MANGYDNKVIEVNNIKPRETNKYDIYLEPTPIPGATISGYVRDIQTKDPIRKANISVSGVNVTTDDNGWYEAEIEFLYIYSGYVIASKKGYVGGKEPVYSLMPGDHKEFNFELQSKTATIKGKVIDHQTGLALEGVAVFVHSAYGSSNGGDVTDRYGNYIVKLNLSSEENCFSIKAPKDGYSDQPMDTNNIKYGKSREVNFQLQAKPATISGRVTNSRGEGIPRVTVNAHGINEARTDNNGYYSIEVPAGRQTIGVQESDHYHKSKNKTLTAEIDGKHKDVNFTLDAKVKSISLKHQNVVLLENENISLKQKRSTSELVATVGPEIAKNKDVIWTSSNPDIVSVIQITGSKNLRVKITGEGIGTSIITVSSKENSDIKATCVVTVGAAITGIEVSPKELPLIVDEKGELKATITTEDGSKSNKKVIWTSSNANVATVDQDGKVTGKSLGTAKVTARIEGTNFTDFSTVTVSSPTVPVTHVKIIPEEAEMLVTQSLALEAKVFPENATNKAIKKWETSSEEIATVDANGLVRAKALGEATITVTTEDGDKQASCKITVKSLTTPVDPEFSLNNGGATS